MRHLAIALALFLGLVTSAVAQEAKQVKDLATFQKLIANKQWTNAWGNTSLKIKSNGTLEAKTPDGKFKGTWYWKGKKFCREGQISSTILKEECQVFYMIGNRIMKNVNKKTPKGSYYFLR